MPRYIVFDVETPNSKNDRMSAIGITVIDGNHITESFFSYINPEVHFDEFNINLTGIDATMLESHLLSIASSRMVNVIL